MAESTEPNAAQQPPISVPPLGPYSRDERLWATFCHLAAFIGYVVPIPVANVVGPLIVWLIKREEYPLVADQGKEALNFQITILILVAACIPLCFLCIGIPLIIGVALLNLIFVIVAAIKANEGVKYRYPFALRLIK